MKFFKLHSLSFYRKRAPSVRLRQRFKTHGIKKSVYFVGDLHLDHTNIIRYCHRPFANVHIMNEILINNWGKSVKDKEIVYFLGDLAFGRNSRSAGYWLKHLPGKITFIKGSHDQGIRKFRNKKTIKHGKYTFVMLHDPAKITRRIPKENTWIIHGHKHNNDIKNYPFINGEKKTINVSVELIDYKPVSLDFLLSLDLDSIARMDTIKSKPRRWKH
jgi:calcineurin-like phosphoesterase family protein